VKFLLLVLTTLTLTSANATDIILPVKGVYDGDTIYSELCALPPPLKNLSIRISGIDTPEIRTTCLSEKTLGLAAKKYLEELLSINPEVVVKNVDWDKYGGRIDGEVFLIDGTNVGQKMIDSGLARPYTGGPRLTWCE